MNLNPFKCFMEVFNQSNKPTFFVWFVIGFAICVWFQYFLLYSKF